MSQFYESERCFRQYEKYIHTAIHSYPEEIRFEPQEGRSVNTDAARCRDAITSWRTNKWVSSLDPTAYKRQLSDLTTWTNLGYIHIGTKASLRKFRQGKKDVIKRERAFDAAEDNIEAELEIEEKARVLQEAFVRLEIEEAVRQIDEQLATGPYVCENTEDNMQRVCRAVEGRMNVVYVINREGKIQIF